MPEFLVELYSEEIPPKLQTSARIQFKNQLQIFLKDKGIKYKECLDFSCPTRLSIFLKDLPKKIEVPSKEIKGPKTDVSEKVVEGFARSHNENVKNVFKKETEKGSFYFIKTEKKNIFVEELLINYLPKLISEITWKKSMKWSINSLMWGRPLRSIFAIFNKKKLNFKYYHLDSTDKIIVEQDLVIKTKQVKTFKEYISFLKNNRIVIDQSERQKIIEKKFELISKSKNFKNHYSQNLLDEVVNLVEDPNVLIVNFDKAFLKIPQEIIISTLEKHQRYFPIIDNRDRLTNYFFVVANKKR